MPVNNKITIFVFCLLAGVLCFVLYNVFLNTYINHDVALNYYYSSCITEGQQPYVDFTDMNAPTIWYLCIPLVWLQSLTSIAPSILIRLFILFLSICSIWLSVYFWQNKSYNQVFALVLVLSCVFLLGIDLDFGQREHLVVLLTVPAFFLFSEPENIHKNKLLIAITTFLFVIGIAIKPLYVILLIPLYFYHRKKVINKNIYALIGLFIGLAAVSVPGLYHYHDYLQAFRFAEQNYFQYSIPFKDLLSRTILPFTLCSFIVILYLRYKKTENRGGELFFLSACIGFMALIVQRKGFTYHYYPLWVFSLLSLFSSLSIVFVRSKSGILKKIFATEILIIILFITSVNRLYILIERVGKDTDVGLNTAYSLSVLERYAPQGSVLNFSTQVDPMAHTLLYGNAHIATQFSCLWFLPVFYNMPSDSARNTFHTPDTMSEKELAIYKGFINSVRKSKPDLIIVNENPKKLFFKYSGFDYLEYYKQDSSFSAFFNNYNKVGFYINTAFYAKK